jgi:hypothetical protein
MYKYTSKSDIPKSCNKNLEVGILLELSNKFQRPRDVPGEPLITEGVSPVHKCLKMEYKRLLCPLKLTSIQQ